MPHLQFPFLVLFLLDQRALLDLFPIPSLSCLLYLLAYLLPPLQLPVVHSLLLLVSVVSPLNVNLLFPLLLLNDQLVLIHQHQLFFLPLQTLLRALKRYNNSLRTLAHLFVLPPAPLPNQLRP